jgi:hypothetical protein
MTLDAREFIRRFLVAPMPDGFHRIRHYGFSPMVIALTSSTCPVAVGQTAGTRPRSGCRKRRRRARCRSASLTRAVWRADDHARHLAVRTGAAEPVLERHLMIAPRMPLITMLRIRRHGRRTGNS